MSTRAEKMSLVKQQRCVCAIWRQILHKVEDFGKDGSLSYGSLTPNYMRDTLRSVGQEENVMFLVHRHTKGYIPEGY